MGNDEALVQEIINLYVQISRLSSLKPSKSVDTLFSRLVNLCIQPNSINIRHLTAEQQIKRSHLIRLCGEAEKHLEFHYAAKLSRFPAPLERLGIFPYYANYVKLARLEFEALREHLTAESPKKVAFVGSGPLPLSSIVTALHHLPFTRFDNFDVDAAANAVARRLVAAHSDLSARMAFYCCDIEMVGSKLREYDVVVMAALVGMERAEKVRIVKYLGENMAAEAVVVVRSAHGARAFLYPVVHVDDHDLEGFDVLKMVHPTDDVINSVIVARKRRQ